MSNNETKNQNGQIDYQINSKEKMTGSLGSLNSFLINEIEVNLSINLSDDLKNAIKQNLTEYEQMCSRKLEEKDYVINQLKQNLVDLTEKRFRTSQTNSSTASLNAQSIEFLLNQKEAQINELQQMLSDKQNEILNLKQTIIDQDNIILSHNNNIYVSITELHTKIF